MKKLTQYIHRYLAFKHCPVDLPWFKIDYKNDQTGRVHALIFPEKGKFLKRVYFSFMWPLVSVKRTYQEVRKQGKQVKKQFSVSPFTQFFQMLYLANFYNIIPASYYKFKLWNKEKRKQAPFYIQHHEICTLLPLLNKNQDVNIFADKVLFYEACQRFHLPTIPIIAVVESGKFTWFNENEKFPKQDLFIKLTNAYCGIGADRFMYDPTMNAWICGDNIFSETELHAHLTSLSENSSLIIQPRVMNHPDMAAFTNGSVSTLRVITFKLPGQDTQLFTSILRMPTGHGIVDNFFAGGIASGVRLDGQLSAAITKYHHQEFHEHPDTKKQITGSMLPHYHEMVSLAMHAHDKFESPYFVGWDLAYTEEGPVLVEGNTTWCVDIVQMSHDIPLGKTLFSEKYLEAYVQSLQPVKAGKQRVLDYEVRTN